MTETGMNIFRRWLIMTALCLAGGVIFLLPFLRDAFYKQLVAALDLTNTQFGMLGSVYGVAAIISYFPGGWLVDRVKPRNLISLSLMATGLSVLYFATFPSYAICLAVHAFWGVTTIFTFWAAMIKATRNWADSADQGKALGILEGGRGLSQAAISTVLLAVFVKLGSENRALFWVINGFSIMNLLVGVLAWFAFSDSASNKYKSNGENTKIGLPEILPFSKCQWSGCSL